MTHTAKHENRQGIYDDVRALSKAEGIIKRHLSLKDREKIRKALKILKLKIWTAMTCEEKKQRAKELRNEGYDDKEGTKQLGICTDTFRWYAAMK
jgi:hypothetical protein